MKKIFLSLGAVVLVVVLGGLGWAFWYVNQGGLPAGDINVDVGNNGENNSVRTPPALP